MHRMAVLHVNTVDITNGLLCMRLKTKKQQKEHVSGYGLREDFNCFTLKRVSSISVTEKNILFKACN